MLIITIMRSVTKNRTRTIKVKATIEHAREAVGISESKAEHYQELIRRYTLGYNTLVSVLGKLFTETSEEMYPLRLEEVRKSVDTFEKETHKFNDDPTVKTILKRTRPRLQWLPFIGSYIRRSNRKELKSRIEELIERNVRKRYSRQGKNVENFNFDASRLVYQLELAEWGKIQDKLPRRLRVLLNRLDSIVREGSGGAARAYINGFTSTFQRLGYVSPDNQPLFLLDILPRLRQLDMFLEYLGARGMVPEYSFLSKTGAVRLFELLNEEDRSFAKYRFHRGLSFFKPMFINGKLAAFAKSGKNITSLTELVRSLPLGRRNAGFRMVLKTPLYADLYEMTRLQLTPREYIEFAFDYGNIPINFKGEKTSVIQLIKDVVEKNTFGASLLMKNPNLLFSSGLDSFLQELPVPATQPALVSNLRQEPISINNVPKKKIGWFDVLFSEDNPLRGSASRVYQKLRGLGLEYRLKQVPKEQLETFCYQVLELPLPLLSPLLRDDVLFEAYVGNLGDVTLLEKLDEVAKSGRNLYRNLYTTLRPPEGKLLSLANRVGIREEKPAADLGRNGGYRRIVIWGDLKSTQKREIQASINDGAEIIFLDASAKSFPMADAVFFVKPRGGHSDYNRAADVYQKRGIDMYHERRHVGSKSLVNGIYSIQLTKADA